MYRLLPPPVKHSEREGCCSKGVPLPPSASCSSLFIPDASVTHLSGPDLHPIQVTYSRQCNFFLRAGGQPLPMSPPGPVSIAPIRARELACLPKNRFADTLGRCVNNS